MGWVGMGVGWGGVKLGWAGVKVRRAGMDWGWDVLGCGWVRMGWEWVGLVLACCVCHSSHFPSVVSRASSTLITLPVLLPNAGCFIE